MPRITLDAIAARVLHDLVECYYNGTDFFMNGRMDRYFPNNEDAAFITNEEIIDAIKEKLANNYYLQVDQVKRTLVSFDPKNNFDYMDTKLEIKLNDDND